MKKLVVCLILLLFMAMPVVKLAAEETEPAEVEVEVTEADFAQKVKDYVSQYTGESLAIKIVGWLVDAGVLSGMFVVWLKYRKYKHNTVEEVIGAVKSEVGEYTKNTIQGLSETQIKSIIDKVGDLEGAVETIMKVLVLMQDTTPEGKVALLDYLGSKTNNAEIKEQAADEKEKIEKQIEKEEEVRDKVADDYEEIF